MFLNEVFSRRLVMDPRVPTKSATLDAVLGQMSLSKTEFARLLRQVPSAEIKSEAVESTSQRRGRSRARVTYSGASVFSDLWSGDTRTMIQLMTDVVDDAIKIKQGSTIGSQTNLPVPPAVQDRVFRNRGGLWLDSQTRNEPTDPERMNEALSRIHKSQTDYRLSGGYGEHLKAIVEAFVVAARKLLLGPTYIISEGRTPARSATHGIPYRNRGRISD